MVIEKQALMRHKTTIQHFLQWTPGRRVSGHLDKEKDLSAQM